MNNFFKTIVGFTLALLVVSCSKDDDKTEPLRDYAEQYAKDIEIIEEFLQTHYIEVINNPGAANDQEVTFTKIPEGGTQTPIWDSPDLVTNYTVNLHDITYKLYYLKLSPEYWRLNLENWQPRHPFLGRFLVDRF